MQCRAITEKGYCKPSSKYAILSATEVSMQELSAFSEKLNQVLGHLSGPEIARKLKMDPSLVWRYKKGQARPSSQLLEALCDLVPFTDCFYR